MRRELQMNKYNQTNQNNQNMQGYQNPQDNQNFNDNKENTGGKNANMVDKVLKVLLITVFAYGILTRIILPNNEAESYNPVTNTAESSETTIFPEANTQCEQVSAHAAYVGRRAVEIVDEFLDGTINLREARDKIEALGTIDIGKSMEQGYANDFHISSNMLALSLNLIDFGISGDTTAGELDNIDTIISIRNTLAEAVI